jgi:hypothetical protein
MNLKHIVGVAAIAGAAGIGAIGLGPGVANAAPMPASVSSAVYSASPQSHAAVPNQGSIQAVDWGHGNYGHGGYGRGGYGRGGYGGYAPGGYGPGYWAPPPPPICIPFLPC